MAIHFLCMLKFEYFFCKIYKFSADLNDVIREDMQYEVGNEVVLRIYEGYGNNWNIDFSIN